MRCSAGTTAGGDLQTYILCLCNKVVPAVIGCADYLSVNQVLKGLRLVVSRAYVEDALFFGIGKNCGRFGFTCTFSLKVFDNCPAGMFRHPHDAPLCQKIGRYQNNKEENRFYRVTRSRQDRGEGRIIIAGSTSSLPVCREQGPPVSQVPVADDRIFSSHRQPWPVFSPP